MLKGRWLTSLIYHTNKTRKWRARSRQMCEDLLHFCEGFLAIFYTKEQHGRAHLSTPHSKLGAVTICYVLMQLCAGINLLYPQLISKFVDVRLLRRMHGLSGAFLLLLATLTLLGGLTTDWFQERVTGPAWYACVACPLTIYSLVVMQLVNKSKNKES